MWNVDILCLIWLYGNNIPVSKKNERSRYKVTKFKKRTKNIPYWNIVWFLPRICSFSDKYRYIDANILCRFIIFMTNNKNQLHHKISKYFNIIMRIFTSKVGFHLLSDVHKSFIGQSLQTGWWIQARVDGLSPDGANRHLSTLHLSEGVIDRQGVCSGRDGPPGLLEDGGFPSRLFGY